MSFTHPQLFQLAEASNRKELEDIVMSLQQELSKAGHQGQSVPFVMSLDRKYYVAYSVPWYEYLLLPEFIDYRDTGTLTY